MWKDRTGKWYKLNFLSYCLIHMLPDRVQFVGTFRSTHSLDQILPTQDCILLSVPLPKYLCHNLSSHKLHPATKVFLQTFWNWLT